jgi:hypothetical protein
VKSNEELIEEVFRKRVVAERPSPHQTWLSKAIQDAVDKFNKKGAQ